MWSNGKTRRPTCTYTFPMSWWSERHPHHGTRSWPLSSHSNVACVRIPRSRWQRRNTSTAAGRLSATTACARSCAGRTFAATSSAWLATAKLDPTIWTAPITRTCARWACERCRSVPTPFRCDGVDAFRAWSSSTYVRRQSVCVSSC